MPEVDYVKSVQYKTIEGYPGYAATSDGEIVSYYVKGGGGKLSLIPRLVSSCKNRYGYVTVCVKYKDGRHLTKPVHRLVAIAFGVLGSGEEVRHLDGSRDNNSPDNLMYGTAKDNADDRRSHGRNQCGEMNKSSVLKEKEVLEIRNLHAHGKSARSIAKLYNVSSVTIDRVVNRITWQHI